MAESNDHEVLNGWVSAHLAVTIEGQAHLAQLIGSDAPSRWEASLSTGVLTLDQTDLEFALLGSVSEEDNTWLWSWANPGLDPSTLAIQRALPLRGFGSEFGLWEFSADTFEMDGVVDFGMTAGSSLASVAGPQIGGGAIFSGSYPGGRFHVVVTDPRLHRFGPSAVSAPKYFTRAVSYGLGHQREVVETYAAIHQLQMAETESMVRLGFPDRSHLDVSFDEHQRMTRIHANLHTNRPAPTLATRPTLAASARPRA
ncbi:MAG: hypothetical protein LBJ44_09405 [Propionibacteriaceae bacterium]|jgi:hypothetical protein|nr:hypothetical protein [Propionibacteriaceae bacterium]